jgi:hypothetical protein
MNNDNIRAYQSELDNIVKELSQFVDNPSLNALIKSTLEYAYALGKSEGYVKGVQNMAGEER